MAIDRNSNLSSLRELHTQMKAQEDNTGVKQHLRGEHNYTCKDSLYTSANARAGKWTGNLLTDRNKSPGESKAKFTRSLSVIKDIVKNSLPNKNKDLAEQVVTSAISMDQLKGEEAIDSDTLGKILDTADRAIRNLGGSAKMLVHEGGQNAVDAFGDGIDDGAAGQLLGKVPDNADGDEPDVLPGKASAGGEEYKEKMVVKYSYYVDVPKDDPVIDGEDEHLTPGGPEDNMGMNDPEVGTPGGPDDNQIDGNEINENDNGGGLLNVEHGEQDHRMSVEARAVDFDELEDAENGPENANETPGKIGGGGMEVVDEEVYADPNDDNQVGDDEEVLKDLNTPDGPIDLKTPDGLMPMDEIVNEEVNNEDNNEDNGAKAADKKPLNPKALMEDLNAADDAAFTGIEQDDKQELDESKNIVDKNKAEFQAAQQAKQQAKLSPDMEYASSKLAAAGVEKDTITEMIQYGVLNEQTAFDLINAREAHNDPEIDKAMQQKNPDSVSLKDAIAELNKELQDAKTAEIQKQEAIKNFNPPPPPPLADPQLQNQAANLGQKLDVYGNSDLIGAEDYNFISKQLELGKQLVKAGDPYAAQYLNQIDQAISFAVANAPEESEYDEQYVNQV